MWWNTLVAVRVMEWLFASLGLVGVGICIYTAVDAWADLRARARAGLNGDLEAIGHITRRGALASMLLHAGFLFLGVTALMAIAPPPRLYMRSVMAASLYVLMQLAVVFAQIRNQYDRNRIRSGRDLVPTGEM